MSVAGDGILERARSTTFALLGTIAAVGLGIVAVAVQQDWPLVSGSPIPGAPKEAGTVHVSRGVALEGATLSLVPGTIPIGPKRSASAVPSGRHRGGGGGSGRHGGSGGPQLVAGSTPVSRQAAPPQTGSPPAPVETTTSPEAGARSPTGAPGAPAGAGTTSTPSAGKALAKGPSGSGKALAKGPTGSGKTVAHGPTGHGAAPKGPAKSYVPSSPKPSPPALPAAPATSPPPPASPGNGVAHDAWAGVQEAAGGSAGSHGH